MRRSAELIRAEPRARRFFALLTQSELGTGAGYVALLLIAYERFESPWAVSLVLLAELIPAMALGPIFGAIADRCSRRACCVVADVVRAVAFVGIVVVPSFEAMVAFAVLAGVGTALFTPASLAALPTLVREDRLPAATALFGIVGNLGYTVGPALGAAALLVVGPGGLLVANGLTFALSAAFLATIPFAAQGAATGDSGARRSLLVEARDGMRLARELPVVRVVLAASGAGLFFAGLFNVAELPFVTGELGASEAAFSLVVAVFGTGFVAGSLAGSAGGSFGEVRDRYLVGLTLMAAGLVGAGVAEGMPVAVAAFACAGFGNGMMLVHERLLIQRLVPDTATGRIYGIKDALTAWAFGLSFILAGALIAAVGVRAVILGAGVAALAACVGSAFALRERRSQATRDVARAAT